MTPIQKQLQQQAQIIARGVKAPLDFGKALPFKDFFFNEDLARQSSEAQTDPFIEPQRQTGLRNIGGQFAGRGLFRSGLRFGQQEEFNKGIESQRENMIQQLMTNRLNEAIQRESQYRKIFEQSPEDFKKIRANLQPISTSGLVAPRQPRVSILDTLRKGLFK